VTTVLLGPQKVERTVGKTLRELGVKRRVALVTAGWQEREAEDAELVGELRGLGIEATNLALHARSEKVFAADSELAVAYAARQELLRHLQGFYRVRLEKTDDAAKAISVRHVEPELLEQEWRVSVAQFRQLDDDHLERCRAIHAGFEDKWEPPRRPSVAAHCKELRALVEPAEAVVIAGGHVASLLNRLKLFDVLAMAAGKHVIGWSAGAMVLTDRIILFHDYPPYGSDIAQVLDAGFALVRGVVVLPDPGRRIRLDDRPGIARFAQRMAPATCVAMGHGARLAFGPGAPAHAAVARLTIDGAVDPTWEGL
jgi:hypothetical protein